MAEPGGVLVHDIGSNPIAQELANWGSQFSYTGPNSDGASAYFAGGGASFTEPNVETVGLPVSMECWFWPFESGGANQVIYSIWSSSGASLISARKQSGHTMQVFCPGGNLLGGSCNLQAWNHLVVTVALTGTTVYLNGSSIGTVAGSAFGPILCTYSIAEDAVGGAAIAHMAISEVAVYFSILSSGQVSAHFAAADLTSQPPVFITGGTYSLISGSATQFSTDLSNIYNSVHRTYPS
jgi:Concanavalin A-like lectin/glucanases superfamily